MADFYGLQMYNADKSIDLLTYVMVSPTFLEELKSKGTGGRYAYSDFGTLDEAAEWLNSYFGDVWQAVKVPYADSGRMSKSLIADILTYFPLCKEIELTTELQKGLTLEQGKFKFYYGIFEGMDATFATTKTTSITSFLYSPAFAWQAFDSSDSDSYRNGVIVSFILGDDSILSDGKINIIPQTNYAVIRVYLSHNIYNKDEYAGKYWAEIYYYTTATMTQYNGLKVTDRYVRNADPYGDGGKSTTGGGGGSFDGTTEIINEPDSPLVNISNTHFVSLYNPTESQINSLSNYMWNTLAIENWRKIVADPMDAIISLAVLPIDVPSSGTREIYVGAFSTGIACNVASAQYISFDCGTLLIPQYSNSYLDFAPYTDISIYIPYVGLRSLPCDAIMGKTIGLKYRIDIFSGACVVYLTVNGSVLLQFTGNCAQPIPFTSQSWGTAVTNAISMVASGASMIAMPATAPLAIANMASTAVNGGFKADITKGGGSGGNTGFLGVQKPYVIIQRPMQCIPANQNTFTGYPSYITATFGDLKGYTEVDKIILENINATESELNELETILKGGVYVNEL